MQTEDGRVRSKITWSSSIACGASRMSFIACTVWCWGLVATPLLAWHTADATPPKTLSTKRLEVRLDATYKLILRSRFEAARKILEPLVKAYPASGRAEFMLGLSHHQQRRYELALPHFRRALELEPDYHKTGHFLGYCLYYLGDVDRARRAFESFLAHAPDNPHTHFSLGLVAYDQDRLEEATRFFTRAIELCGEDRTLVQRRASAHARLADVYTRSSKLQPAREHLELATQLNPDLYGAHFKLWRVLTRLGEHDAARQAYQRFLQARKRSRAGEGVDG